jgi:hypothetical protein
MDSPFHFKQGSSLDSEQQLAEAYIKKIHEFVKSTGGGCGEYIACESRPIKDEERPRNLFHQHEWCSSQKLGFGRISFPSDPSVEPKQYLRVPHDSDPDMLVHFVENVWNISQPKLLIGITGGAQNFGVSEDLEQILNELMQIARQNDAWIITGGTRVGIMKYIGSPLIWSRTFAQLITLVLQGKRAADSEGTSL